MSLFNRIKLLTPESVELELTLAGIGRRSLAVGIDYSILFMGLGLFSVIWLIFATQLLEYLEQWNLTSSAAPTWLIAIYILATFLIYSGYFVCFEALWQGQTPGKRFANIRVVQDDGKPIGITQATLRALLRSIDDALFGLIGILFICLGKREKRLGDWVAGTLVVQEEISSLLRSIAISPTAERLAQDLKQSTELAELQPDDFAVIREYLQRRRGMSGRSRLELSTRLAGEAQKLMNFPEIDPKIAADDFLEALYVAYQRQSE